MSLYPIRRRVRTRVLNGKPVYSFFFYWANGKAVDGKHKSRLLSLGIPPVYKNVKIYSPQSKILYEGTDSKNRVQTMYHPLWIIERERKRFRGVLSFAKSYSKLMKKVKSLISKPIKTKEQKVALAIALLDKCKIRSGSERHLKFTGSYGATTLCKKHVRFSKNKNGNKAHIVFRGKSGVQNECSISSKTNTGKKLYSVLRSIKNKNEEIFKEVTPSDINSFLRENGAKDISSKTFRTYHANQLFIRYFLRNTELPESTIAERKKNVVRAIKKLSAELHHNPSTFRKSYLFPALSKLYIESPSEFRNLMKRKNALANFIREHTPQKSVLPSSWKAL